MELLFAKENWQKALQNAQNIAVSTALPILSCVLVEAEGECVQLTATDLEVTERLHLPADVIEEGKVAIPARKLAEIVRELPPAQIRLRTDNQQRVEIDCERGHYQLTGAAEEEFPALPVEPAYAFVANAEDIRQAIQKTLFAVSNEASRYFLNGLHLHVTPEYLRIVGTDIYRLALWTRKMPQEMENEMKVILPTKAATEIPRLFADAESLKIGLAENHISFDTDGTKLVSRLVEGEYPKYQKIIPTDQDISVTIDTKQFLAATKRVSLLANPKTLSVKLDIQGETLELSTMTPDFGEASETISVQKEGSDLQIGFNAKFLMDALQQIETEKVQLGLKDALKPAVLRPVGGEEYLSLIMPARIN